MSPTPSIFSTAVYRSLSQGIIPTGVYAPLNKYYFYFFFRLCAPDSKLLFLSLFICPWLQVLFLLPFMCPRLKLLFLLLFMCPGLKVLFMTPFICPWLLLSHIIVYVSTSAYVFTGVYKYPTQLLFLSLFMHVLDW